MDTVILTKKQAEIMDIIAKKPGAQYKDIIEGNRIKPSSVSRTVISLMKKGLVRREGEATNYAQYWTGVPYEVGEVNPPKEMIEVVETEDKLIGQAVSLQLTEEQKRYVKEHKNVPRSKLAARFGMSKLAFNFALAMSK